MSAMLAHESLVHGTRILFRSFRVYGLDAVINLHTVHCQFLFGPTACCRHEKTKHKGKQQIPRDSRYHDFLQLNWQDKATIARPPICRMLGCASLYASSVICMNAKFDCPYDKEFNMPSSLRQLPIKFNILMISS